MNLANLPLEMLQLVFDLSVSWRFTSLANVSIVEHGRVINFWQPVNYFTGMQLVRA